MNTKEILSIVALAVLGLCLLCSLAKAAMKKGDKGRKHCDKACGTFVMLAIALLAVSQFMGENEKYGDSAKCACCSALDPTCGKYGGAQECGPGIQPVCPSDKYCTNQKTFDGCAEG